MVHDAGLKEFCRIEKISREGSHILFKLAVMPIKKEKKRNHAYVCY